MKDELLAGLFPLVCGFVALLVVAALLMGAGELLGDVAQLLGGVLR